MSASLAAAKKRRANIQDPPRVVPSSGSTASPVQPPISAGLTLPQVIQVVDNRLIILEKFMRETKESSQRSVSFVENGTRKENAFVEPASSSEGSSGDSSSPIDISDVVEEFDNRYKMLAEQISDLKDIVLKLQSYTMDVNKTLLEERVRIFSELDASEETTEVLKDMSIDEKA